MSSDRQQNSDKEKHDTSRRLLDRHSFPGWLAEEPETKEGSREAMRAHSALVDQTEFRLKPEQWQAFCDLLDAPPKGIDALRRLFAEKAPWE